MPYTSVAAPPRGLKSSWQRGAATEDRPYMTISFTLLATR